MFPRLFDDRQIDKLGVQNSEFKLKISNPES